MTEESKTPKYLEDIVLYQYADVAARLASNEQTAPFVSGGLEKMVGDFEKVLGANKELLDGFKAGAFASEEGIKIAMSIYAKKYRDALGKVNIPEFYTLRLKTLNSLLGKEKAEEAQAVFAKYDGQTISSIIKKYEQSNVILRDETGLFDEKRKEEAKKTKGKIEPMYKLIQLIEQRNYEELMPGATKSVYKQLITEALEKA